MASNSERDRRLVAAPVHSDFLINSMRQGHIANERIECVEGLPADAIFVGTYPAWDEQTVYFVFYHPSFDKVADGVHLPIKHVLFNYRSSRLLTLAPFGAPGLTKALVESLDDVQLEALRKILLLLGCTVPEKAEAGKLTGVLLAYLRAGDEVHY